MSAKTHIDHVAETIDEIGPFAFPFTVKEGGQFITNHGMTLRDYFAAAALGPIFSTAIAAGRVVDARSTVAATAYLMADAMLKAREAKP